MPPNTVMAVRYIIPGGEAHGKYKLILKDVGEWAKSLKGNDGNLVPIIFRPFHEFDGGWFWWGKPHCTREEFISLWKFTVSYLRDSLDVHNLLVWRNDTRSPTHYYAPFPGQVSVPDFIEFYNDSYTLFENDLRQIYKR